MCGKQEIQKLHVSYQISSMTEESFIIAMEPFASNQSHDLVIFTDLKMIFLKSVLKFTCQGQIGTFET